MTHCFWPKLKYAEDFGGAFALTVETLRVREFADLHRSIVETCVVLESSWRNMLGWWRGDGERSRTGRAGKGLDT